VGVEGVFFFQAAAYVAAAVTVAFMRVVPKSSGGDKPPFFQTIFDGVAYVRRDRTIFQLLATAVVAAFFGMAYMQLMPAYAGDVLDLSGSGFGFLMIFLGVGGVIGSLAVAGTDPARKGRVLLASVLATGALQIVLGGFASLPVAIVMLMGLGAAGAFNLAMGNTLIQTNLEDQYRGRVMSLYFMSFGLQPLGALLGGGLAEVLGLGTALVILGCIVLILAGNLAIFSRVRTF